MNEIFRETFFRRGMKEEFWIFSFRMVVSLYKYMALGNTLKTRINNLH